MHSKKQSTALIWLWLSVAVIVVDQLSKAWVVDHLQFGEQRHLLPMFNLTLAFNTGAAFSFLGTESGWQVIIFSFISIVVVVVLGVWLARLKRCEVFLPVALSLVIGGAAGNLIDRLRLSYVVDFFDFHIGSWHFATFNVGDAAISVGTVMLIIKLLFFSPKAA